MQQYLHQLMRDTRSWALHAFDRREGGKWAVSSELAWLDRDGKKGGIRFGLDGFSLQPFSPFYHKQNPLIFLFKPFMNENKHGTAAAAAYRNLLSSFSGFYSLLLLGLFLRKKAYIK